VARQLKTTFEGEEPDLAVLFSSPHHFSDMSAIAREVSRVLSPGHLIGCTGESIIGGKVEYEGAPAVTLWAAGLPGTEVASGHIVYEETPHGFAFLGIPEIPLDPATLILLGDPFSFPADIFLQRSEQDYPELQIFGGMASGAMQPGRTHLISGSEVYSSGAVAAVLSGGVRVKPVVSQGCRPFGKHLVITKADQNVVLQLGGVPAFEKLKEQLRGLTPSERLLVRQGLHLGIAIDARKRSHGRGDFLVRNVIGVDQEKGGILVTDVVRAGQTVQFHLRDAETASEDLQILLKNARLQGAPPGGALLFSCNGRGSRLFDVPSHDARAIAGEFGDLPLAGFFAAGEVGPVGGKNFLHGFTASLALFENPSVET
jgi:small ligand-binding sensory domain FIST